MPKQDPEQLRGPVAEDFGFTKIPKASAAQNEFGLGYKIGFFTCFALAAASFITLFFASDAVTFVRAFGYVLASFGILFAFGIGYNLLTNKSFPWTVNFFGNFKSGVLDRRQNPIGYWVFVIVMGLVVFMLVGCGLWVRTKANVIAPIFQHHRAR